MIRESKPILDAADLARTVLRGRLFENEPMARHVSWRAGGRAARAYASADLADLQAFLRTRPDGERISFVGLGSNLLVRDGGFAGTVILMHTSHGAMRLDEDLVYADAGVACPKVARFAATRGREGAEFLAGVPGTMGGALAMNAGCYGAETWSFVERVDTVDRHGAVHARTPKEFVTGYRHVALKGGALGTDEWFVGGWFAFPAGDGARARERIRELLAQRLATQPLSLPNAGSVFRNPPGDHAARLVEACGLKGYSIGGASISEQHANFIVNPGGKARASEIEALIAHAHAAVLAKFGIDLVVEVHIIGDEVGSL